MADYLERCIQLAGFRAGHILPRLPWLVGVSGFTLVIEIRVDAFGSLVVNIIQFYPFHFKPRRGPDSSADRIVAISRHAPRTSRPPR